MRPETSTTDIYIGDEVLLKNNKPNDRKGRKFGFKWLGQYIFPDMTKQGLQHYRTKRRIV